VDGVLFERWWLIAQGTLLEHLDATIGNNPQCLAKNEPQLKRFPPFNPFVGSEWT